MRLINICSGINLCFSTTHWQTLYAKHWPVCSSIIALHEVMISHISYCAWNGLHIACPCNQPMTKVAVLFWTRQINYNCIFSSIVAYQWIRPWQHYLFILPSFYPSVSQHEYSFIFLFKCEHILMCAGLHKVIYLIIPLNSTRKYHLVHWVNFGSCVCSSLSSINGFQSSLDNMQNCVQGSLE